MLLTALIMLIRALKADRLQATALDEEFGEEATGIDLQVILRLIGLIITAVVSWLLIQHVGFEPAMTLLLIVTMLFVGVRKPLTIALTSILMPIILSQAAWHFFSTQMPGVWR